MTVGKDVSGLFPDVLKNMQTEDLEQKKLVYLYLMNYAKTQPELVILAVNTFVKDASDPNPLVRALSIRTMGCLRAEKIIDYLSDPLAAGLQDDNPYVRKTAALCVAKMYDLKPSLAIDRGFVETLQELVGDPNPTVVANAVTALTDIHNSPHPDSPGFIIDRDILNKILVALNECTEWGRISILSALCRYTPTEEKETEYICERVLPQFQHANGSVVLSAIKVVMINLQRLQREDFIRQLVRKMAPPLVTLVASEPEVQWVALRNINLILQARPDVLSSELRVFFCKYSDAQYNKVEKLDILVKLANENNVDTLLNELKEYASEVDVDFVRRSIRAIGRCAIKIEDAAERCVQVLVDLINTKVSYVVQEAVIVIKDIFRKYPHSYEAIIPTLCENLEEIDEPESKASLIWILGENAEKIVNVEELLETYLDSFIEDSYPSITIADRPPIVIPNLTVSRAILEELVQEISSLAAAYHKPASTFVGKGRLGIESIKKINPNEENENISKQKALNTVAQGVKAENLLDLDEDASPSTTQSPQESFNSFTANTATSNINHAPSPAQSNPVDDLLGLFGNATVSSPSSDIQTLVKYIKAQLDPSVDINNATEQLKLALKEKAPPISSKDGNQVIMFELLNFDDTQTSLASLLERYGNDIRVRTDSDMNWFVITGLNHKPAKLSQMISKMTGYDSKTVFYCVKILIELDLVVKMHTVYRGSTTNVAIHRKFLASSPHYRAHALTEAEPAKNDSDNEAIDFEETVQGRDASGLPEFSELNDDNGSKSSEKVIEEDMIKLESDDEDDDDDVVSDNFGAGIAITVEKQILNLIHESGIEGMTISSVISALPTINRRTVENILLRHETDHDPASLTDLALKSTTEMNGRERRQRFFTRKNYILLAEKEGLDIPVEDLVSDQSGSLNVINSALGCSSRQEYQASATRMIGSIGGQVATPKKLGRPPKAESSKSAMPTPKPKGRPRKSEASQTPSEVPKKRGRPRKSEIIEDQPKKKGRASKNTIEINDDDDDDEKTVKDVTKKHSELQENVSESIPLNATPEETQPPSEVSLTTSQTAPQRAYHNPELDMVGDDNSHMSTPNKRQQLNTQEVAHNTINVTNDVDKDSYLKKRKLRSRKSGIAPILIDVEDVSQDHISTKRKRVQSPQDSDESDAYEPGEDHDEKEDGTSENQGVEDEKGNIQEPQPKVITEVENQVNKLQYDTSQQQNASEINELDVKMDVDTAISDNQMESTMTSTSKLANGIPRSKTTKKAIQQMRSSRTDLSQHRRIQDLYNAIKSAGGMVEAVRELFDVYQKYVHGPNHETAAQIDRPVVRKTLNVLFNEGKLKETKVSSRTYGGASMQKRLIYVSDIDTHSEAFRKKKEELGQDLMKRYQPKASFKEVDTENIGYINFRRKYAADNLPENCTDPSQKENIRNLILSDVKAMARLHGYMTGRFAKAHTLYSLLSQEMQQKDQLSSKMSDDEPIVCMNYFKRDIPLNMYMKLIPWTTFDEMAFEYKNDPSKSKLRIKDLPEHLQELVSLSFSKRRHFITECVRILWHLNLVELMEEIEVTDEIVTDVSNLKGVRELKTPNRLLYFRLKKDGLFLSFEDKPVLIDGMTLNTNEDIDKYFERLKVLALSSQDASMTANEKSKNPDMTNFSHFASYIQKHQSWQNDMMLSAMQKRLLANYTGKRSDIPRPGTEEEYKEIAYTCGAPLPLVKRYIEEETSKQEKLKLGVTLHRPKKNKNTTKKLKKSSKYSRSIDAKVKKARSRHMRSEESEKDSFEDAEDAAIVEQIREFRKKNEKKKKSKPTKENPYRLDPPLSEPPGKSPEELIEEHKRLCTSARQTKNYSYWNPETDELLRDSIAIIKARTRNHKNTSLSAALHVFPRFKTERLANEYESLCKDLVKEKKMEKNRSLSLDKIDFIEHLKLIRIYIDKRALYINTTSTGKGSSILEVPDDVQSFFDQYDIAEETHHAQQYQDLQSVLFDTAQTEIAREHAYSRMVLFDSYENCISRPVNTIDELNIRLSEVAIKVSFMQLINILLTHLKMSTHDRSEGHMERSQEFLKKIPDEAFQISFKRIKDENILYLPANKSGPTALYAFSDIYKHDSHGPWQAEFMQDFFDDIMSVQKGDVNNWPIVVQESLQAALLSCISSNQIKCSINIENFSARIDSIGSRDVRK
ncbi:hypothetical protein E3Q24_00652 [Wallemia mellicola]|nr:hypothetical protein E3Q24_00652 [Wallemia mellicola]